MQQFNSCRRSGFELAFRKLLRFSTLRKPLRVALIFLQRSVPGSPRSALISFSYPQYSRLHKIWNSRIYQCGTYIEKGSIREQDPLIYFYLFFIFLILFTLSLPPENICKPCGALGINGLITSFHARLISRMVYC